MKKALLLIVTALLWLTFFCVGCTKGAADVNKENEFCRVLCQMDDGIIVWTENIGYMYVKHIDTDLEIKPLDTVVMEFAESDLQAASGTFTDYFGTEREYAYILEKPKSIRHTTEGEPTFG